MPYITSKISYILVSPLITQPCYSALQLCRNFFLTGPTSLRHNFSLADIEQFSEHEHIDVQVTSAFTHEHLLEHLDSVPTLQLQDTRSSFGNG